MGHLYERPPPRCKPWAHGGRAAERERETNAEYHDGGERRADGNGDGAARGYARGRADSPEAVIIIYFLFYCIMGSDNTIRDRSYCVLYVLLFIFYYTVLFIV